MYNSQQHAIQLEITYPSGAELWSCPDCGRRFVAQWEPKFRRVILEQGNETIIHTSQGLGIQTQISLQSSEEILPEIVPNEIELNDIWKQFLDKLDFDSEGDNNLSD